LAEPNYNLESCQDSNRNPIFAKNRISFFNKKIIPYFSVDYTKNSLWHCYVFESCRVLHIMESKIYLGQLSTAKLRYGTPILLLNEFAPQASKIYLGQLSTANIAPKRICTSGVQDFSEISQESKIYLGQLSTANIAPKRICTSGVQDFSEISQESKIYLGQLSTANIAPKRICTSGVQDFSEISQASKISLGQPKYSELC
jgi:hypothetical protein